MGRIWSDEGRQLSGETETPKKDKKPVKTPSKTSHPALSASMRWAKNNPDNAAFDNDGNPVSLT